VSAISVTVVLALSDRAIEVELTLPRGATVSDALAHASLAGLDPRFLVERAPVGIFGRRVELSRVLDEGDRVEVYRPLNADPKAARRKRAGRTR
jgi:putative ubiquitin-RnfH superfamily antitoxin RatB of RatAB toxin-antitoxin module